MEIIINIIAATLPALVVFMTVYVLMKQFFQHQRQIRYLEIDEANKGKNIPQKILAYERLTLFCERIRIPNLLMRLSSSEEKAEGVLHALLIAVQKEYEHNITQQLYVSENLWKIISFAKNEILNIIHQVYADCEKEDATEFRQKLINEVHQMDFSPVEQALSAIRKEANIYLS